MEYQKRRLFIAPNFGYDYYYYFFPLCFCFLRHETRFGKKKKLKINIHRPVGTRVVFDEEGNTAPPLAKLASQVAENDNGVIQLDKGNS